MFSCGDFDNRTKIGKVTLYVKTWLKGLIPYSPYCSEFKWLRSMWFAGVS